MGSSAGGNLPQAPQADYLAPRRVYGPSKAKVKRAAKRKPFMPTGPKIRPAEPRRCETNQVGAAGECLHCDAEQGETCKAPSPRARAAPSGDGDAPNPNDPHVPMT